MARFISPRTNDRTERITLRIPPELKAHFEVLAARHEISVNEAILLGMKNMVEEWQIPYKEPVMKSKADYKEVLNKLMVGEDDDKRLSPKMKS